MNPIIKNLEAEYTTRELPDMNPGDTVRVFVKIVEGNKERIPVSYTHLDVYKRQAVQKLFTVNL